jgi:hypothetical protein
VGGISIQLLDVPKATANDPRARVYIVDYLHPGTTIDRRIEVGNTTSTTQHVTVYAGGAAIVHDQYVPAPDNELSGWIMVTPGAVDLKPGHVVRPHVVIAVPKDASAGERYATVWAQVSAAPNGGVGQINRVGIRVYLDIGPGGAPRSDFSIGTVSVERGPKWPVVSAQVTNTGQRAVDVSGSLTMSSADDAIRAGPFNVDNTVTLLPGKAAPATVTLDRALPDGHWNVTLKLTSGTITHSISGRITLGGSPSFTPQKAKSHSGWTSTIAIIGYVAAGIVLAALAFAGFVLRHRRQVAA